MSLRPYQQRCIEQARAAYSQGSRAICIVAPTGAGKTRIASAIAGGARGKLLWVVHRQELIEQAQAVLPPGTEVRSVQGMLGGDRPHADILFLDECHHYAADQWGAVAQDYLGGLVIGLTATPERSDGRPLGDIFTSLVVAAQYSELVEGGWLVPCDVYAPDKKDKTLAMPVAEAIERFAEKKQSITFCATVNEARKVTRSVGQAAVVSGETRKPLRKGLVSLFRNGLLQHLVNVYVFSEGFDAPAAEVCILARGAGHASTYLQMVGRVLRPAPGKDRAVLVDLCGSVHHHGWPTEDRNYSLAGDAISRKAKAAPIWQCKGCGICLTRPPTDRKCPRCLTALTEPESLRVARKRVERQEYFARQGSTERDKAFEKLRELGRAKGYSPGWAAHRYKARYGRWPG